MRVDHIGSTAVPGLDAKDVIDIQVTVESLDGRRRIADALANAGYPAVTAHHHRPCRSTDDPAPCGASGFTALADPGRPANIHVRVDGWPGQQFALLFRDWLAANPVVQRGLSGRQASGAGSARHADAKEPWFADAYRRAWEWAETTGWRP